MQAMRENGNVRMTRNHEKKIIVPEAQIAQVESSSSSLAGLV